MRQRREEEILVVDRVSGEVQAVCQTWKEAYQVRDRLQEGALGRGEKLDKERFEVEKW